MNDIQRNFKSEYKEKQGSGAFNYHNNRGSSSKGFLIFSLIILLLLFITNPTMDDYSNYAQKEVLNNSSSNLEKGLAALLVDPLVKAAAYRDNYYIFSIYSSNLDSKNEKILGIFKTFIKLEN